MVTKTRTVKTVKWKTPRPPDDEHIENVEAAEEPVVQLPLGRVVIVSNKPKMIPADEVEDLGPEVTDGVSLGFLRDGRLRVKAAIPVVITRKGDSVTVDVKDLNVYGQGRNLSEALIDLQHAVVELYFAVKQDRDNLGKGMMAIWSVLQGKIEERSGA